MFVGRWQEPSSLQQQQQEKDTNYNKLRVQVLVGSIYGNTSLDDNKEPQEGGGHDIDENDLGGSSIEYSDSNESSIAISPLICRIKSQNKSVVNSPTTKESLCQSTVVSSDKIKKDTKRTNPLSVNRGQHQVRCHSLSPQSSLTKRREHQSFLKTQCGQQGKPRMGRFRSDLHCLTKWNTAKNRIPSNNCGKIMMKDRDTMKRLEKIQSMKRRYMSWNKTNESRSKRHDGSMTTTNPVSQANNKHHCDKIPRTTSHDYFEESGHNQCSNGRWMGPVAQHFDSTNTLLDDNENSENLLQWLDELQLAVESKSNFDPNLLYFL